MSNYNSLKATIDANIKQNGNQEITGQILNSVLNQMVTTLGAGYQFAGVATIGTNPGTPDAKVFYIANGKGTYEKFGGINVTEDDVVVLYWDTAWHKVATGIASQAKLSELENNLAIKVETGTSEEIITILNDFDEKIAEITTDGIKNYFSKIIDSKDNILISNDGDGISSSGCDMNASGKELLIKDDSDSYIGEIKNDGIHAKAFFLQNDEYDTPRNIESMIGDNGVKLSLPNNIYAVVGDTLQIFFRGIMQVVNPYNYDILVTCSKGNKYPRYFEYTPTPADLGTTPFKITIKNNNGDILAEKSCNLVTIAEPTNPTTMKHILCFGDSLTSAGTWCEEACRRLIGIGGTPGGKELTNISFKGQMHNNLAYYFGKGGWKWEDYTTAGRPAFRFQVSNVTALSLGAIYTNNGHTYTIIEINVTNGTGSILCSVSAESDTPTASGVLTKSSGSGDATITFSSYSSDSQNPLWDYGNNKMTFIPYADEYCNGQIDAVYTLLSWNGQSPHRTDFSSVIDCIKIFADTLHSEFPSAKLKIMGVQVPSINGGMGANYGATGSTYADGYGMIETALNMNNAYQDFANTDEYSSFVEFINVSSQFDSENNMPQVAHAVNTRNTETEMRGTNGVHPAASGYYQIGDIVYRNVVKEFCQ